jgi:hypothetical protein
MIVVGGYTYGTKSLDRRDEIARIRAAIPSLRSVVSVPYGAHVVSEDVIGWADLGMFNLVVSRRYGTRKAGNHQGSRLVGPLCGGPHLQQLRRVTSRRCASSARLMP